MDRSLMDLDPHSVAINDENFVPSSEMAVRSLMKFSPVSVTAALRQSQRDNIRDSIDFVPTKIKGSLQNPRPLPVTPTRYEDVLKLDEEESWKERCAVITRPDHEEYVRCAQDILVDLIENLPVESTPEKPYNLEIPSLETRSVSSSEFTPSESSFNTAREELHSISLLPDLLQPETLHDWRVDGDRSDTDYESATDSSEVAAEEPVVEDSVFPSPNTSQRGYDREVTPVPELLADNQPISAIVDRSFNFDSDREKTPVPSNTFFLPDLASESLEVVESDILRETDVSTVEFLDNAVEDIIVECTTSPATVVEAFNTHVLNYNTLNSDELEPIPSPLLNESAVELQTASFPDTANVELNASLIDEPLLEPIAGEEIVGIVPIVEDTDPLKPEATAGFEANTCTLDAEKVEAAILGGQVLCNNNSVKDTSLRSESDAVVSHCDDNVTALATLEALITKVSEVAESTVNDEFSISVNEYSIEPLLESVPSNYVVPEQDLPFVEVTDSAVSVAALVEDTLPSCTGANAITNTSSLLTQDLPLAKELQYTQQSCEDFVADSSEIVQAAEQLLNKTFEVAAEPDFICEEKSDFFPVKVVNTPEPTLTSHPSEGNVPDSAREANQLESTFIVEPDTSETLTAGYDEQSYTFGIELESSKSVNALESSFVVDPATVASTQEQCLIVKKLLPASQEASADIKQLLERAARAVANLHDIAPTVSSDIDRGLPTSPKSVPITDVELPVAQNGAPNQERLAEADIFVDNQISEIVCKSSTEVDSLKNSLEVNSASAVDSNVVEQIPFDLDQCLELEATIIATELFNLSLREGQDGEADQSMKDKKMVDLENNESLRVVGDVAPSLDDNVNPFQSKPRVVASPMRAPNANGDMAGEVLKTPILGSKGLKNGEVTPKVASSGARTPTRKTSSPSSRTTPISNSPKRKGSSSLESGLAEGERENGVGSPFTPSSRLGRSPPRTPARDANKEHLRKAPVKTNGSPPKEASPLAAGKPSTPGSIDGSGEGFTRCAPEGAPAQSDHNSEIDLANEFKRPLPKPAPRVKGSSDCPNGSPARSADGGAGTPTSCGALGEDGSHMMVRSVEDRVNSEAGPDVAEFADGEFRCASDVFKDPAAFEFLQMAGNKQLSESALARMSLYVKFDPLLKAISPVSRRSLSKGSTSDHSQTSSMSEPSGDDLLLGTPSKSEPMLDLSSTPGKGDGCSEGRLLDITPLKFDGQSSSRHYSEEEFAQALRMQELLFQEQLIKKDREWDERTRRQDKEHAMTAGQLIADNERLVHEFQKLQESHQQMTQIVSEYERTISQLITDRESEKLATDERASQLKKELDQALEDLQSVEGAFADLHRRYEKSKVAVDGFKKNEEVLKTYVAEGQGKLKKQEQKYELLKHHAEEKLESANTEIDSLRHSSESEVAALRAQLKKAEMKVNGLERTLDTKVKENAELTNICDELIAKVGHGNS